MASHDPSGSWLIPREEMGLSSRLSESNSSFRATAARPVIIQKVPQSVRGGLEERYFAPDVVSIGPYHHRTAQHLADMEVVKESVAYDFCRSAFEFPAGQAAAAAAETDVVSPFKDAVTSRMSPADLRGCYADKFDHITDTSFVCMMVVDGCFLLAVMAILTNDYPLEHSPWTHGRMLRIIKDVLLFENQIPWTVLQALMALRPVRVDAFVSSLLAYFDIHSRAPPMDATSPPITPVHLLDLFHQRHLGTRTAPAPTDHANGGGASEIRYCNYARPFAPFTSAVELAEAGIHLSGSGTCRVTAVTVEPAATKLRLQIGRLVLPQLALSWLPRCWLLNMVALECVTDRFDNSGVSSYLAILGSLVRAERDVEELRSRRILFSTMSDRRTVDFFEGLLDPLPRQELYLQTLEDIVDLRTKRSTRSGIHGVYYRNRRYILTAAPLLSLLVAIIGVAVTNSIKHTSS